MKKLAVIAAIAVMLPAMMLSFTLLLISGSTSSANCASNGTLLNAISINANGETRIGDSNFELTPSRLEIAAIIYQLGLEDPEISNDDTVTALMAAMQESGLANLAHLGDRNDHNSLGVMQQQYGILGSDGREYWGTPAELTEPVYAVARFYQEMKNEVPERSSMRKAAVAQEIQRSAFPEAYAKWEDEAWALLSIMHGSVTQKTGDVAVIGDSLTVGSNNYLFNDLAQSGYQNVRVEAQSARSIGVDTNSTFVVTTSGESAMLDPDKKLLRSGISAVRTLQGAGYSPQDWIVLLGTNDIGLVSSSEEAKSLIVQMIKQIGSDTPIMWSTIWDNNRPSKSQMFNSALIELTDEYPNLYVADWAGIIQKNPDLLTDGVHYSTTGYQQRSNFIAKASLQVGSDSGNQIISSVNRSSGLSSNCSLGGFTADAIVDAQAGDITNPRIATIAGNFEQIVGGNVLYGASRSNWTNPPPAGKGRKGNFGHGNKEQWLRQSRLGPMYRSLDCSGFTNMVLYMAYGVNYTGCSHSYKNIYIDGQPKTVPILSGRIIPTMVHAGDFIIREDRACNSNGIINHIVIVLGVRGDTIVFAGSRAGSDDGYNIEERTAQWFSDNWPDLIVSRWIGEGAERLTQPQNATTSTSQVFDDA